MDILAIRGGDGEACQKASGMRYFWVIPCPERQRRPLSGPPESLGMERMRQTPPMVVVGCIVEAGQKDKTELLAYMLPCHTEPGGQMRRSMKWLARAGSGLCAVSLCWAQVYGESGQTLVRADAKDQDRKAISSTPARSTDGKLDGVLIRL